MKIKRILSVALALCVALAAVSFGAISAYAEEAPEEPRASGGWEFSDISAGNVDANEQAVLNKALEGLTGADYEAKDVIATQPVAGTNYAFLCKTSAVVPNAQPYWTVVTVYADLQGNASLTNIATVDCQNVVVKANTDNNKEGAWSSEVKENAAPVPENVKAALDNNVGLSLSPIAVLGTQVVAGKNYRILAYGTTVTADPKTDLYIVDVYASVDGSTEISSIAAFGLEVYVTPAAVEEPDDEATEAPTEAPTEKPTDKPAATKDTSPISPKTGSESYAMIVVSAASAVALFAFAVRRKRG